jgi:hypothetical protein
MRSPRIVVALAVAGTGAALSQQGNRLVSLIYVAREGTRLPPFRQ